MSRSSRTLVALMMGATLMTFGGVAQAQRGDGHHGGNAGHAARPAEPERAPVGYQRVAPPQVGARPQQLDRGAYNHNFVAQNGYHIGPYHGPRGFSYRRWSYGDMLPRVFWGRNYWLTDFWLFGLDVPPMGYEWVRYGPDALLVDVSNGEVVQVIYGRFL